MPLVNEPFSQQFKDNLNQMSNDMRFPAWYLIIVGGFYCLTIIGAIIGVPFLLAGLRLKESIDDFKQYLSTNELMNIELAIEKQMRYYKIIKIMMIISLVFLLLYVLFMIFFGAFIINEIMNASQLS